mgnify:CR=1 FL=1
MKIQANDSDKQIDAENTANHDEDDEDKLNIGGHGVHDRSCFRAVDRLLHVIRPALQSAHHKQTHHRIQEVVVVHVVRLPRRRTSPIAKSAVLFLHTVEYAAPLAQLELSHDLLVDSVAETHVPHQRVVEQNREHHPSIRV